MTPVPPSATPRPRFATTTGVSFCGVTSMLTVTAGAARFCGSRTTTWKLSTVVSLPSWR